MMAERKYCPLKLIKGVGFCEKERCAWWDDFTGHCAILSISRHGALGSLMLLRKKGKVSNARSNQISIRSYGNHNDLYIRSTLAHKPNQKKEIIWKKKK